ncbi:hypothetical protein M0804_009583 [Polistes exclamans]|nr:hypothetical protein M0804_009583 [Polistes exclamans]
MLLPVLLLALVPPPPPPPSPPPQFKFYTVLVSFAGVNGSSCSNGICACRNQQLRLVFKLRKDEQNGTEQNNRRTNYYDDDDVRD